MGNQGQWDDPSQHDIPRPNEAFANAEANDLEMMLELADLIGQNRENLPSALPIIPRDSEKSESDGYIILEPEWENMLYWQANALATHSFEFGAKSPVGAFADVVRYLTMLDSKNGTHVIQTFLDNMKD